MHSPVQYSAFLVGLFGLGCETATVVVPALPPPQNLTYELEPSGDPSRP